MYNFSVVQYRETKELSHFVCQKLDTVVIYITNESYAAFAFAEISAGQVCLCKFASWTLSFTRALDKFSAWSRHFWECKPDGNPATILFLPAKPIRGWDVLLVWPMQTGFLHSNMPVSDFHFWVYELLMNLKTLVTEEVPLASKIWESLAQMPSWNSNVFQTLLQMSMLKEKLWSVVTVFHASQSCSWSLQPIIVTIFKVFLATPCCNTDVVKLATWPMA